MLQIQFKPHFVAALSLLFSLAAQAHTPASTTGECPCSVERAEVEASSEVRQKVLQIAARQLNLEVEQLDFATNLREFGADTMTAWEIAVTSAETFGVDEVLAHFEFETLGALAEAIEKARPIAASVKLRSVPEKEATEQVVFYATNRAADKDAEHTSEYFSGERAPDKKLQYGRAVVTIPKSHSAGSVEGPFMGLRILENPSKHILLQKIDPLDADAYFEDLKTLLASGKSAEANQAVVFVHGFNVAFDDGVKRSAQIAHDIGFAGAPILFSWPSDAKASAYVSDREDAFWSVEYLQTFLAQIKRELAGSDIHLIAHSMGNQVLLGALRELERANQAGEGAFRTITLAAPDFDADLFAEQYADHLQPLGGLWTIYSSDKDVALDISVKLNSNKRLGQPVTPLAGYQVIDASGVEVTPWAVPEFHSYYATKQRVVDDIVALIRGEDAQERGLNKIEADGLTYFELD